MISPSAKIAVGVAALLAAMLLFAASGPLATDDLWWHLALGHHYAETGFPLEADPHLHTAVEAPPANAWLFDYAVAAVDAHFGLQALRGVHVLLLLGILAFVARALYLRSRSLTYTGLGTSLFIACAAYRLVQFRPDLCTLLATSGLTLLLFASPRDPTRIQIGFAIALCALWSNLHPGFLLGPALIAAAAGGHGLGALIGPPQWRPAAWQRAFRFACIAAAGLLATTLNPEGIDSLLRYFQAGLDSAGTAIVVDEWRAFTPFAQPTTSLPPAPLAFGILWVSLIATPAGVVYAFRHRFIRGDIPGGPSSGFEAIDEGAPALAALAVAGWLAPFVAVRFTWLILFPLLFGAELWRNARSAEGNLQNRDHRELSWLAPAAALVALALIPLYWTNAEQVASPRNALAKNYRAAFDTDRYSAHAVWFLADSDVEGRLFHPYYMGGFLDYWLAPRCQTFIDGSLNVPPEVLADYGRLQRLGQNSSTEEEEAILDAYEIDFFVGVGLPTPPLKGRPWRYTTNDLTRSEDWMLVFRNLRSAVYMRRHPRNSENLTRISAYYAREGVTFSAHEGLDLAELPTHAPEWAIERGILPRDFQPLKRAALGQEPGLRPELRAIARDRLATTYAVLGMCDEALAVDLDLQPGMERSKTAPLGLAIRAPARERRIKFCQASMSESDSSRAIWLTPVEAGRIKGVQRKALTRTRNRHEPYSGNQ